MKKQYTKKMHEDYLNNLYSDIYSLESVIEEFSYITENKTVIAKHYNNNTLGSFLKNMI